jgi:hypothetical protein
MADLQPVLPDGPEGRPRNVAGILSFLRHAFAISEDASNHEAIYDALEEAGLFTGRVLSTESIFQDCVLPSLAAVIATLPDQRRGGFRAVLTLASGTYARKCSR